MPLTAGEEHHRLPARKLLSFICQDADIVIALGPGFVVGTHCDAVVETMRGHRLGRVLFSGMAELPRGSREKSKESQPRVIRAPQAGRIDWSSEIGDWVEDGSVLGEVVAGQQRRFMPRSREW